MMRVGCRVRIQGLRETRLFQDLGLGFLASRLPANALGGWRRLQFCVLE